MLGLAALVERYRAELASLQGQCERHGQLWNASELPRIALGNARSSLGLPANRARVVWWLWSSRWAVIRLPLRRMGCQRPRASAIKRSRER